MTKFRRKRSNTRNNIRKADAILAADWHIRPDIPTCRTDDYFHAMKRKIDFILNLSEEHHNCPILVAGDLGQWALNKGWPTWLLEWTIKKFEGYEIICIAGQHDLPNHKLELWEESGVGVLHAAGAINLIFNPILKNHKFGVTPFHYGQGIQHSKYKINPQIAMTHQAVLHGKSMFNGIQALELLKEYPEYNLILSGDNHLSFTEEYQGRILVNPGSMMRNSADQEDHEPRVYLWYANTNEIEAVFLPIEQGVISREHIKDTTERDGRFDALITRIKNDVELKLSYPDNIVSYLKKYRTVLSVKEKVLKHVV